MTVSSISGHTPLRSLEAMLSPRSIAVFGANDEPMNLGRITISYLERFGFAGPVYPVNPSRDVVAGLKCFARAADIPEPPELAIFAVRGSRLNELVRECAEAGIRYGTAWAGGFAEAGPEGAALQAELTAICREYDFWLLGPNCLGFINAEQPTIASFASFLAEVDELRSSSIAMVSQSGGFATQAQAFAQRAGFGFRFMVSVGNEADLAIPDFIGTFAADPGVRVIATYLEAVRDGARLIDALDLARDSGTPVIALTGGRAPAAAKAATAHTGAMAGESRVLRSALKGRSVMLVDSLEELLDVALLLETVGTAHPPRGNRVAIITLGGGGGVLAVDQAEDVGLQVAKLSVETTEALRALLPPTASLENPIDITPEALNQANYRQHFSEVVRCVCADDGVDGVLVLLGPMRVGVEEVIEALTAVRQDGRKPFSLAWPLPSQSAREQMAGAKIHYVEEVARATKALGHWMQYGVDRRQELATDRPLPLSLDWDAYVPEAVAGTVVPEQGCHELLTAAGLPVAAGRLVTTRDELARALAEVRVPVVMKGQGPSILHRDAAGLVLLDITSADEAEAAFDEIHARARAAGAPLDGVYVQHMVAKGAELLISAFVDPVFGVTVSCGAGGTLTELLDDVQFAPAPITPVEAFELLNKLRVVRYLESKGRADDLSAPANFMAQFSRLAASAPWSRFILEVNPIKWQGSDVVAVDGLLIIEQP